MVKRYPILDVCVDAVDMRQALDRVVDFVEKGDRLHTIFAVNPEKNFSVPKDAFLHNMFINADLLIPDGIGIVLAAGMLYGVKLKRVPGCEFMQNTCALAAEKGYRIFIYGAQEDVSRTAVEELKKRFHGIQIAGRVNGYLPDNEMDLLVEKINESGAQILFLALGSPKQEAWISTYKDKLKFIRACQGIGGTLDVIAGRVKRAPAIYCALGLEWFYRLLAEPRRYKRQSILPVFAYKILKQKLSMMFYAN